MVKLERNYRSTDCILDAAQALIANNRQRKEKRLWTDVKAEHQVRVLQCADENDEAREIANQIHALRQRGRRPDQIAIFYRANFMQRALERAMRLAGVPYQIVGGVEFYQRREIRDLVSYLHLAVNPRDDVAFRRVVNVPARGHRRQEPGSAGGVGGASAACRSPTRRATRARGAVIRGRAKASLAAFGELLDRLGDLGRAARGPGPRGGARGDRVHRLVDAQRRGGSGQPRGERGRAHDPRETWDRDHPDEGLRGFLQEVALVSDVDAWQEDDARVTLMTLHSSKGLEFPACSSPASRRSCCPTRSR